MTTYASFKPSAQFLEAGEKAHEFTNAANTFKPFLSKEARQSIEGVDKVAQAFTATGQALKHFGFDEAEPEVTTSEVELIPTDDWQVVDNMNPTFGDFVPDRLRPSTYVIGAGEHLQGNGWDDLGKGVETAGQGMRFFGFDEADEDEIVGAPASDIVKGVGVGISAYSPASMAVTTIGGVTSFTGFVLGRCGLDVDESEAHAMEDLLPVATDPLA